MELIETGWEARGSPRRVGDSEGVGGNVGDSGSLDKTLLAAKVWMPMGYEVMRFS
jgi:hypothetical protein